jgi:ATP-binding cassette subfamily B protein
MSARLPGRVLGVAAPLVRAAGLVFEIAPGLAATASLLLVVDAALGLGVLYLLKLLVNAMSDSAGGGTVDPARVSWLLLWTAVAAVLAVITQATSALVARHLGQTVSDRIENRVNRRVASADLAQLEDPAHYDLVQRALLAGGSRPAQAIVNAFQAAQSATLLAGMAVLLLSIHWALVALLLVALVPGTWLRFRQNRLLHDLQVRQTRSERHAYYLRWLMTEKSSAMEVRIYGLGDYFARRFEQLRDALRAEKFALGRRRMLIELSVTVSVTVAFFAVIAWLVGRVVEGSGTYGELVLFLMVFMRGQGAVLALKGALSALFDDHLYLRALFQFFDRRDAVIDPEDPEPVPRRAGLELRDVSFRYPGSADLVLDRVSITVPPGQVVAVVGANGSGKTTLIKLLCRLYDPGEGAVLWGGSDVRNFRQAEYRERVGVLFQDYVCYDADLIENIRLGEVGLDRDSPRIREVAKRALVDDFAGRLPKGYETHLGRVLEEGAELSVGQWQRLALARSLIGDSDLVVLDEPTSAMDPDAEARLFDRFRDLLGERSALVISHRLSIVRGADHIYVMRHGRIVEHGTHDELMRQGGHYHDVFLAQARAYQDPMGADWEMAATGGCSGA